jgi:transposase InsO family protein
MDIHKNARLTPLSRELLAISVLSRGITFKAAALQFNVSPKTVAKWVRRFQKEGPGPLADYSSRPHRSPRRCSADQAVQVEVFRRMRWSGFRIALATQLSRATVSRILRRIHLSRISDLEPPPPVRRYEHPHPGDLLHLDIKKLGRFQSVGCRITGNRRGRIHRSGWEYLHVAIDDHSRIAFSLLLPNQKASSAIAFLQAALDFYARLGINVRRLITDNGPCYRSGFFRRFRLGLTLEHRFTRPYTPRTNGKAERFIQTALREWAYARSYDNSQLRAAELGPWIHQYNWHRPHARLNHAVPISRSGLDRNNLLTHHT